MMGDLEITGLLYIRIGRIGMKMNIRKLRTVIKERCKAYREEIFIPNDGREVFSYFVPRSETHIWDKEQYDE